MTSYTTFTRVALAALTIITGATFNLHAITDDEQAYLESYGWIIAQRSGIVQLGLNEDEHKALLSGLKQAVDGKEPPQNLQLIGPDMNLFLKKKSEAFKKTYEKRMKVLQKSAEKEAAVAAKTQLDTGSEYFKTLDKNDKIKSSDSGLYYEIIKPGSEPKPKATDTVIVHYEGQLIDGTVFDSSIKRGEPATFALDKVIPGWTEGLQLIGKGGKAKLYIPSDLAYGNKTMRDIPPGSTLIFDIELIDINPEK